MTHDKPTLATVAAAAGVSRMTVSNAYNRPDQLSAATRERVLAVAAELGYPGPDPAGRSLRSGRVGAVGVLLTDRLSNAFADPGLVALMRGLTDGLSVAQLAMLLVPVEADQDGTLVRQALVDAFVVGAVPPDVPAMAAVLSRRQPVVTVGQPRVPTVPFVGIDNAAAAALAAEHLLGLGHRRFGVLGLTGGAPSRPGRAIPTTRLGIRNRVDGFVAALAAVRPRLPRPALVDAEDNTVAAGVRAASRLLGRPAGGRPSAIFAVTDVLALGVLQAAGELGLRVPADLSVVGFDDIEEAARAEPPLTTVSQSLYRQGKEAARAVLALLAGRRPRASRITPVLQVRASTAPPA